MRPIPVAFHIWFVEIHTYGIGLALTFWFGLRYTERRLRNAGYPWRWVTGMFFWVVLAAIVGARALHVLSNLSYYSDHPGQVFAIWQGGLSSFGGLLFAVPVAIVSARRRCPELPTLRFADVMAPVLMACWGIGRLLGPQLMVAGGGHPTNQWFGMYYAGQVGKRLPVPIFQAMEDFAIFGILLLVERWLRSTGPDALGAETVGGEAIPEPASAETDAEPDAAIAATSGEATGAVVTATQEAVDAIPAAPTARVRPPAGIILGVGMVLWGIERFLDEHLWLGEDGHLGSLLVQWAGVLLAVGGAALLASRYGQFRRWRRGEVVGEADPSGPAAAGEPEGSALEPDAAALPDADAESAETSQVEPVPVPEVGPAQVPEVDVAETPEVDVAETPEEAGATARRSLARFGRRQPAR